MARKKESVTCYFDPEQLVRLRALSKRTRIAQAEYIRDGLELVLEKNESAEARAAAYAEAVP